MTPRTPDDDIREGQVSRRQSVPEMLDAPKRPFAPTQPARAHLAERVVTDPAALPAALDDETRIPASGRFAETIPAIPEPTNCDLELLQFLPATYHSWLEHGGVHIVPSLIRLLADARRDIERLRTVNEALAKAAGVPCPLRREDCPLRGPRDAR